MKIKRKSINWVQAVLFVVLIFYGICLILPLLWGLMISFKSQSEAITNLVAFPKKPTFGNYITAFQRFAVTVRAGEVSREVHMAEMYLNSIIYALGGAALNVFTVCVTAYATARFNYKLSKIIYGFVVVSMILPIVGSLPSEIAMTINLGIYDSFIGIFLLKSHFIGVYYLVMHATFKSLSNGYAEAAAIDGASHLRVFVSIMVPLVKNVLLTIGLIKFIEFWNDYQVPMIYIPNHPVLAYGMYRFSINSTGILSSIPMKVTGCMLLFIPIFVVFLIFHKRLMTNLTMGGMKE